jgi:hypothetical protein
MGDRPLWESFGHRRHPDCRELKLAVFRAGRAFWARFFTGHTRVIGSTHWDRTGTFVLMCLP